MLWASVMTAPLGLTEPIFVPAYWNPPSLFDLAQRTGFDLESLIFSFAIGGVGVSLYKMLTGRVLEPINHSVQSTWHRYHGAVLLIPVVTFPLLLFTGWNPIYPAIMAVLLGALGTIACRPDLTRNTAIGGILFLLYYSLFMLGLESTAPGYIAGVWNLPALSGIFVYRIPLEELLFGFAFGAYWASIYEHLTWRQSVKAVGFDASNPGTGNGASDGHLHSVRPMR
jgi:hypothetical protein